MSDRSPLNEAAVAAQRKRLSATDLQSVEQPVPETEGSKRAGFVRKPFGSQEQKLFYPNNPGFHGHWFNDEPGRIMRAKEAGYEHVLDEKGKPVCTVVGIGRGGGPLTAYLMQTPIEWYREDMAAQESVVQDRLNQIRRGDYERPTGRDGSLRYAGSDRGNISIETGGRR